MTLKAWSPEYSHYCLQWALLDLRDAVVTQKIQDYSKGRKRLVLNNLRRCCGNLWDFYYRMQRRLPCQGKPESLALYDAASAVSNSGETLKS